MASASMQEAEAIILLNGDLLQLVGVGPAPQIPEPTTQPGRVADCQAVEAVSQLSD